MKVVFSLAGLSSLGGNRSARCSHKQLAEHTIILDLGIVQLTLAARDGDYVFNVVM